MSFKSTRPFWAYFGGACVIFAFFFGIGQCAKLIDSGMNQVKIEKEKTKQLEIKLEIEKLK